MNKSDFNKNKLENTLGLGKEKVDEQLQAIKRKNYGEIKVILFIVLLVGIISLGFYYNIIQDIFYSFLSIIVLVFVLVLGIVWEYIIFKYITLEKIQYQKYNVSDFWKMAEQEFEILKADYEQKIKQLNKYSILNYMTSIGLFLFSCIVLLIDWIYNQSFTLSAYQEINPTFLFSLVLILFSLIFMVLHYLNQTEINKMQEKFFDAERWIFNIKSAYLLGKEDLLEKLLLNNNMDNKKQ
jgi:magnesium-transporting ATPase (P-type)